MHRLDIVLEKDAGHAFAVLCFPRHIGDAVLVRVQYRIGGGYICCRNDLNIDSIQQAVQQLQQSFKTNRNEVLKDMEVCSSLRISGCSTKNAG